MRLVIARSFGVGLVFTLVLAVLGGVVTSRALLRRVDAVTRTTREIIGGDFKKRVPLRGTGDEFDDLGAAVNAMLDKIDDLMDSMRRVSGDVAHDLRTPLTRLRQQLERARQSSQVADLHTAFDGAVRQVDSILETFTGLLRIAQVEAGANEACPTPVNVSTLLSTIVEDFAPAAEDQGQRLIAEVEGDLTLSADRELLTQLITNLVDNAIRHSRPGSEIRVQGRRYADGLELAVADTGPGIPEQEREKVLRPFYRLEASRTTEGSGLGLSLVAAIAKRHRAHLQLLDNAPGLRVSLQFPAG
jgi:signal transduction histidine kinase